MASRLGPWGLIPYGSKTRKPARSDGKPLTVSRHRGSWSMARDSGKVLTGVRLFGQPFFEIALAVDVPELRLPEKQGKLVTIDASKKSFEVRQLIP